MDQRKQIYTLFLTEDGAPQLPRGYVYLPPPTDPPYSLRFVIEGSSPICRKGSLWVNVPSPGESFSPNRFKEFNSLPDFAEDPSAVERHEETVVTQTHFINVCPKITIRGQIMPLDSLSVFSVVSKFMGVYPSDWDKHLRGISNRGYNMVHFTPLMQRGASGSPYSLYDQHVFDENHFPNGESDVADLVERMEKEYGLLSLTDVVWNHTAHNSKWIEEHPEAGYNIETAPWLDAALELDNALLEYGERLAELGLPTEFETEDDLVSVMERMTDHVISPIKLWEYYTIHVEDNASAVLDAWMQGNIQFPKGGFGATGIGGLEDIRSWSLEEKATFLRAKALENKDIILGRYSRVLKADVGAALLKALHGSFERHDTDISHVRTEFVKVLDQLNLPLFQEFDADVSEISTQVYNRVKYVRLDDHGPKLGPVTKQNPLVETYFTRLPLNQVTKGHSPKSLSLVNNGWVWNADAMKDHAGEESRAYLRREVIVWGDCVKLRYGRRSEDNPFLWNYMADYTRLMAKHFKGFRVDNCHSTPLSVAEYLLNEARKVRPGLVVFAELFTGSEETDYIFTKRLGLTSLIREAMQAWNAAELSRLVHRHGGRPIGSFDIDLLVSRSHGDSSTIIKHVEPTPVHALFTDCTHDNEMPAQKRDSRDTLPNAALVAMCASATGSVFGYDEIYPRHVNLVQETRVYSSPYSEGELESSSGGIGIVKKLLNAYHTTMAVEGYDETHIHHDGEYITVHRVHPDNRKGVLLIAHSAFSGAEDQTPLDPVYLTGTKAELVGSWKLEVDKDSKPEQGSDEYLEGLPSRVVTLPGPRIEENRDDTVVYPSADLVPGSIAILETWIPGADFAEGLSEFVTSGATEVFSSLDLIDLNFVLYRCDAEERDSSDGQAGVYDVPNFGPLAYAGLQGWWSVLESIVKDNDLGHPMCDNLRDGQWALDYIVERMQRGVSQQGYKNLRRPTDWLEQRFDAIRKVPNFLLPRYFAIVVRVAYEAAWRRGIQLLDSDVTKGQHFIRQLSMVSIQQVGYVNSSSLYPSKHVPCLAAGLPHFSTDWSRCWGRDVFISLRGLLLCTGRFDVAKEHILAFASVLKHGMIPNLLSSGTLPRYNSRDSVWFFLQAIQDYTLIVPNGLQILEEQVHRRFLPYDDTWFPHDDPRAYSQTSSVAELIQEIFQRHAAGISFREYNAGPELDMQMKPEGFQIDINVDWGTGLVFGGNRWNCGTWMDKMGESVKAGNQGYPGTPRDGAAIEITGLIYSALVWILKLHRNGHYKNGGVRSDSGKTVSFDDWARRIKDNFERCYYIPRNPSQDDQYDVDPGVINRRGIYKDLYRSGLPYEDYQLRANFPIAMTVAPDLFDPEKALHAIHKADSILRGPTGMATLDPSDLNYRPYYNNSEDSTDFKTSKGRNYHQGPEWLWPTGYFLRALLNFGSKTATTSRDPAAIYHQVNKRLLGCKKALRDSPWAGLTELTNQGGEFCEDSSPTQAWSAACLLDLHYDASQLLDQRN